MNATISMDWSANGPSSELYDNASHQVARLGIFQHSGLKGANLSIFEFIAADLRYSIRTAVLKPSFALLVVASLALGIGGNTALFCLVDHLLLASPAVKEPDKLVYLQKVMEVGGDRVKLTGFSRDEYETLGQNARGVGMDVVGFLDLDHPAIRLGGKLQTPSVVEEVSRNFFDVLEPSMMIGRTQSDVPGAVLSYRLWQSRFHSDPGAIGQILDVNRRAFPIVGVASPDFFGLELDSSPDIWLWSDTPPFSYELIGRLRRFTSAPQVQDAVESLFLRLNGEHSEPLSKVRISPLGSGISSLREQYKRSLLALAILVAIVLLMLCTNIGTLLVIRNSARARELSIRVCLGADRSRLMAQLLVESATLAAVGAVLSVGVAYAVMALILSNLPTSSLAFSFHINWRVLAFTGGLTLICLLLFAVAPAWQVIKRTHLADDLKAGSGTTMTKDTKKLGNFLIVLQVALSLVLLLSSGLFLQTIRNLTRAKPGFDSENLLQIFIDTEGSGYEQGKVGSLYKLLVARLAAVPGVTFVSGTRNPLMRGPMSIWKDVEQLEVGPQFFRAMRIPLLRGRAFNNIDYVTAFTRNAYGIELSNVVIISESFAKRLFSGIDPIGRRLPEPLPQKPLIIGVVKDAKLSSLREFRSMITAVLNRRQAS